jgi:large subunit ribosomal protein L25
VELWAPANAIPEVLVADLTGLDIGDQVRMSAITLPEGVEPTVTERDFVVATVTTSSSMAAADEAADTAAADAAGAAAAEVPADEQKDAE